ncbi:MAG: DsbA family protein [bacterium]
MGKSSAFLGTVTVIAVALLALYGIVSWPESAIQPDSVQNMPPTVTTVPGSDFGNPSLGEADAPLTVFVYGDYQCIACAQIEPDLIEVVTGYPNQLRLVWKDLPNERIHPDARNAAVAARCANDQGGFWKFHDLLMSNQSSLDEYNFSTFAAQSGLDAERFSSCYTVRQTEPLVDRDVEEALALGVDATPYLFVGRIRLTGAVSADRLRATIDSELARLAAEGR